MPPHCDLTTLRLSPQTQTARFPGPSFLHGPCRRCQAANSAFIFFSALASTWRMRSAETPYSSASSCSVTLLSSSSQRRLMMSRERASSSARPSRSSSQLVVLAVVALVGLRRILVLGHQVGGRRRRRAVVVVVVGRVEADVAAGQARLHLQHFALGHVEVRPRPRSPPRRSSSPGASCDLRRLKNSLRCALVVATLTMRQFLQDELVHLGADPVHREADQAHARRRGRSA